MSSALYLGQIFFTEGDGEVFVIDLAHQCLKDRHTSCVVQGSYRNTPVHSILQPPWPVQLIYSPDIFTSLFSDFPGITETNMGKVTVLAKPLHINTGDAIPASRCRPLHGDKKSAVKADILKSEAEGIIELYDPEWASPVHAAMKPDGSCRVCGDFRRLNMATKSDKYPLPSLAGFSDDLAECTIFSKIDLRRRLSTSQNL